MHNENSDETIYFLKIEDSLFMDFRFQSLIANVGNQFTAIGLIVAALQLCRTYILKPGYVPEGVWPKAFNPLVECGLAETISDESGLKGVSLVMAASVFKHRIDKSNGGKSKSIKKLKALEENRKKAHKQQQLRTESKQSLNRTEQSLNRTEEIKIKIKIEDKDLDKDKDLERDKDLKTFQNQKSDFGGQALRSLVWDAYADAYRIKYGVTPVRNKTTNSQIKSLTERLGEDSVEVVKFYVDHPDPFFAKNTHTIGLCLARAESLHTQWQKGLAVTNQDLRRHEQGVELQRYLEKLSRGEA